MSSSLTLKEVLSKAPDIHVFDRNGVTILKPKMSGAKYRDKPLSEHSITGNGTKQQPFTPRDAMDVNPHNVIVDLWLRNLSDTTQDASPIFIQVNDWILQVKSGGVISKDGHFTKLLPRT